MQIIHIKNLDSRKFLRGTYINNHLYEYIYIYIYTLINCIELIMNNHITLSIYFIVYKLYYNMTIYV